MTGDIQIYTIPSVIGCYAAHHTLTDAWDIFPAVAGGYRLRRDWRNPMVQSYIVAATNGIEPIYRADIAMLPGSMEWLGITSDEEFANAILAHDEEVEKEVGE